MDYEIDYTAVVISLVFDLIVLGMVWKSGMFATYPLKMKIFLTLVVPPVFYFVVQYRLNK